MSEIGKIDNKFEDRRRYERYPLRQRVRAVIGDKEYEGVTNDISAGGTGLLIATKLDNDHFIDLHIENVGTIPGHVVRVYEGGAAVAFDTDAAERTRIAETLSAIKEKIQGRD